MILCVCKSVPERAVRAAQAAGARTLAAISAATGAGADCGCCQGEVERILAEPCRAEACPDCPARGGGEAVPRRAAADGVKQI